MRVWWGEKGINEDRHGLDIGHPWARSQGPGALRPLLTITSLFYSAGILIHRVLRTLVERRLDNVVRILREGPTPDQFVKCFYVLDRICMMGG